MSKVISNATTITIFLRVLITFTSSNSNSSEVSPTSISTVAPKTITIIRIISKDYNLLIMKDYLPIIGEIEGSVDIKNDIINESFKNIKAFYMNSENVFNLMIKEG